MQIYNITTDVLHSCVSVCPSDQLEKLQKAASAAHTYFVANPSHLEMRNNIEKYRRMDGVTEEAFQDREIENEKHWVSRGGDDFKKLELQEELCTG